VDVAGLAAAHPVPGQDGGVVGGTYSTACYIEHSLPSLLFLAYKYADTPAAGLLANTNAGGENCHRGAALGALLGAAHGMAAWPDALTGGLAAAGEIRAEADALAGLVEKAGRAEGRLA
jgi:hypothetical protein